MSDSVPDGWELKNLGAIYKKLSTGMTPSRAIPNYFNGHILWVTSGELNYNIIMDTKEKISIDAVKDTNLKIYPAGTFFIAITGLEAKGTRGRCAILGTEATTNQSCMAFNKNPLVDTIFLFQFYKCYGDKLAFKYSQGTKQQSYNADIVKRIPISLPPLTEQQKIASILTSVDTVIEKTEAQISKLKDLKKAMMQELLTKGIGHTEFKDSPIGRIPKGWEVNELKYYLSFISYGFTNPMPESDDGYFMVTAKDIFGGEINLQTCRKTTSKAYLELLTDKSRPKVNDILLTKDGTLGRLALVEREGICINQSVAVLRPNDKVIPKLLQYLLESPLYQKQMIEDAGGSTIKHIYITIVDKMAIVLPSDFSEQQKLLDVIQTLDDNFRLTVSKNEAIKSLKKALMQDLLTGKVRVAV
jgi:type I restriction enzyme, S subunit